jgi:hypothetical protein
MVKTCNNCYWLHESEPHIGCYHGSKWRKWIPKKDLDVPRLCGAWKSKDG